MIITWSLTFIFLIGILLQMGFIGRYISMTQNIFNRGVYASFVSGAVIYFALTFLALFPFIWIDLSLLWYAIIIFIKDFFTIVFLITRREKMIGWKVNWWKVLTMTITSILLIIIYRYGISNLFTLKELPIAGSGDAASNDYQTYSIWVQSLYKMVGGNHVERINYLVIHPIVAIIMVSSIGSIYESIKRTNHKIDYFIIGLLTLVLILLFHDKTELKYLLYFPFILIMIHFGYNLILYSRRRFGTFFGLATIVIWTINPVLIWSLLLISLSTALLYIFLKKNKPALFLVQILSPMLIIIALNFAKFSTAFAFALGAIGILLYISIFFFGRITLVERANFLFNYASYIWLIATAGILFLTSIIMAAVSNEINLFVNSKMPIFTPFDNNIYKTIINIFYYIIDIALLMFVLVSTFLKINKIKQTLLIMLVSVIIVVGYNPFVNIIFTISKVPQYYEFTRLAIYPVLIIVFVSSWDKIKTWL